MWWWFWGDCYTFCDTSRVVLRWTFHLLNKRQYINSQKKTKKLRSDEESCVFLRVNIDRHWNTDDIYIIILFLKKLYHFKLYNRSRKHLLSELNSDTLHKWSHDYPRRESAKNGKTWIIFKNRAKLLKICGKYILFYYMKELSKLKLHVHLLFSLKLLIVDLYIYGEKQILTFSFAHFSCSFSLLIDFSAPRKTMLYFNKP